MTTPTQESASPAKTPDLTASSDVEKHSPSPLPAQGEKASSAGLSSTFKALSVLDRFLAVWIFLAMLIGILLGNFAPTVGPALKKGTFVGVSVPIAVGLLVMMYPILCKVQYEKLHEVFGGRQVWVQLGFSVVVNWIVAPFIMVCFVFCFFYVPLTPYYATNMKKLMAESSWHYHGPSSRTNPTCGRASSSSASPAA
jgi:ACR3 family arsenite transporter